MPVEASGGGGFRLVLGLLIAVVAVGSIGLRAVAERNEAGESAASKQSSQPIRTPAGGSSFDVGSPPSGGENRERAADDDDPFTRSLPVVTEASFFAMIGFALGYLAKKVVKLAMIFLALIFILLQVLSYVEVITIDWSRAVDLFNDVVLNLKENQTIGEVLKNRLPAAGGLVGGYLVGFRKG